MSEVENKVVATEEAPAEVVKTEKKKAKKPVVSAKKLRIEAWQKAAEQDGFNFSKDKVYGEWNKACEAIAKVAIVKCRSIYINRNLTMIVQTAVGVTPTGKCDIETKEAIKKFQRANKLLPNGIVDSQTWKRVLKV